jgi:hypothetical protein
MSFTQAELAEFLLKYDARHLNGCPQKQQAYWRMRPEYRPHTMYMQDESGQFPKGTMVVVEKPCTCGLDAILGHHDQRKQS